MLFFKYKNSSQKPENKIFPLNRTLNQLEFIKYLLCDQYHRDHRKSCVIVSNLKELKKSISKITYGELQISKINIGKY